MFVVIVLLVIILICVVSIELTLKRQLTYSKEIDKSLKQLVSSQREQSSSQQKDHSTWV